MASQIQLLRRALGLFVSTNRKNLGLALIKNLTDSPPGGTPIKTGFAVTNWVPTLGTPFEGLAGTKEEAISGSLNIAPQNTGIAQFAALGRNTNRGADGRFVGRKLFVTNNVPYIGKLNAGSSRQSPSGFVQTAIARAIGDAATA